MRSLIDMAADRAPYIDQSQSLNLFVESPSIGKLSSMYFHAWKTGVKNDILFALTSRHQDLESSSQSIFRQCGERCGVLAGKSGELRSLSISTYSK